MSQKGKIKTWYLIPLSLLALGGVAAVILLTRDGFSTEQITLQIEGPDQIENGVAEEYKFVLENNSDKTLKDINISLDLPDSIKVQEGGQRMNKGINQLSAGKQASFNFTVVASSNNNQENILGRADYSPEGVSARFVSTAKKKLIIGKLDVTMLLNLPDTIYADQEIQGEIFIVPNSDIESAPLFLRLSLPEGFSIQSLSNEFDFQNKNVWRLGNLKEGEEIRRSFRGNIGSESEELNFSAALGKLEGVSFLAMNQTEHSIEISKSPIFLEQNLTSHQDSVVKPGDEVTVEITSVNKSDVPLEDVIITTTLPEDIVDFSSISSQGMLVNEDKNTVEWNAARRSGLGHINVEEEINTTLSFNVKDDIRPRNVSDTNKLLNVDTTLRSDKEALSLGGAVLQANNILSLKLATKAELAQNIFRGGEFETQGPHPPEEGELSTYTVEWKLNNTTNATKNMRVEAVLPDYVEWQEKTTPENEDIRYISSTNTVVWEVGGLRAGTGYIYPEKTVQFQIGARPEEEDVEDGVTLIEQTKMTGVDAFTSTFFENNLGETTPEE